MRILNSDVLTNHGDIKGRTDIVEIMEAGLQATDPYYNTLKAVRLEGTKLTIGSKIFEPVGDPNSSDIVYDLSKDIDRIFVFGAGKGIQRIAKGIEDVLKDYLTGGFIIVKHGDEVILNKVNVAFGGHPVPDECCVESCHKMVSYIREAKLTERDLVFVLIGNGVSSILTMPPEGVSLESIKKITQVLQIQLGLNTIDMNKVRVQSDLLKGGRITKELFPAKIVHFFGIDINEKFASGRVGYEAWTKENTWLHSLPDSSTVESAIAYLKENNAWDLMNDDLKNYLLNDAKNHPVLSSEEFNEKGGRFFGLMPKSCSFIPVVMNKCRELGYEPHHMCSKTNTEASVTGLVFGQIAKQIKRFGTPFKAPCALLITGELLVSVGNEKGIGGRNQEFQLSLAKMIDGIDGIVGAGADTDGTDGPGGRFNEEAWAKGCKILAGGVVDSKTAQEARDKGIDINTAIKTHATSDALWRLDSAIWATQNISVNDLILILIQ